MITFEELVHLHKSIKYPLFKGAKTNYNDLQKALATLPHTIAQTKIGESIEGRSIVRLDWGCGTSKIVLWSQMHGNEGTSTRALIDLLRLLTSSHTPTHLLTYLNKNYHFIFLPMLNPDGAERWQRENALGIDLNRDARRFTTPEAQLLRKILLDESPSLCFNLHDQSIYYAAGSSLTPATITLLAPPIDEYDSLNSSRHEAIRLAEHLYHAMQSILPRHTAKWNDDYEVRAFGEWAQTHIAPTLLIEAGGYPLDPNREVARSLMLALILHASLMHLHTHKRATPTYSSIPLNRSEGMFDRIERNISITHNEKNYTTDIGYRENEIVIADLADYGSLTDITEPVPWL